MLEEQLTIEKGQSSRVKELEKELESKKREIQILGLEKIKIDEKANLSRRVSALNAASMKEQIAKAI